MSIHSSKDMKNIAVVLSGSGVYDGSEIHEAVLTFLNIELSGSTYQCFAPDITQHHVVNHLTGEETHEKRNVLVEAARIARGDIKPLSELNACNFDAVIVPWGFGAAKNLSDFAFKGAEVRVQRDTLSAITAFASAGKPVGLICIAPAIAGKIYDKGVTATIGNDEATASAMVETGVIHKECSVSDIVLDEMNKLVSTPAYMLGQSISEINSGIQKLVTQVIKMA